MSTLVISGGTDGIGRGLALHYLRAGHEVAVIGRSEAKFRELLAAAGGRGSAHLVRADLALAAGNRHAVAELTARFATIDALVLCAAYVRTRRTLTAEGLEHTFALYYLSRYLLSHGLADRLEAADRPVILNTAVPGAPRDAIHWNDLQLSRSFTARRANHQSRRANHLLGLMLTTRPAARIRHILYNPGFVATSHAGALNRPTRALVTTEILLTTLPIPENQP
jgi:NAD(P)-dependent dehydrogenase (short-subunit alcohol dehydrogenase family)